MQYQFYRVSDSFYCFPAVHHPHTIHSAQEFFTKQGKPYCKKTGKGAFVITLVDFNLLFGTMRNLATFCLLNFGLILGLKD